MELLKIEDLTFSYPKCSEPALKGLSFSIKKGSVTLLCGATGSGKSTLLRLIKREQAPMGKKSGRILFNGTDVELLDESTAAFMIGYVTQEPDEQIVTDKVWHELAFGLENRGVSKEVIARRIAETASFFGIEELFLRDTATLSGGQKQLLNLAAVMVTDPDLLILDEPTAQLDPIAAERFLATVKKLCDETGVTVLIAEHRTDLLMPFCDEVIALDGGTLLDKGAPREVAGRIFMDSPLFLNMPLPVRVFRPLLKGEDCPLTVKEGRSLLEDGFKNEIKSVKRPDSIQKKEIALQARELFFRYEKNGKDVLGGLDLEVHEGEIFMILGGNGSGKSTALFALSGLLKPYSGRITLFGKGLKDYKNGSLYQNCLSLLPQDVQSLFLKDTVKQELSSCGAREDDLPFSLSHLYDKHPYDLSGGEQQLLALAKALSSKPRILLLDEPTKGLDGEKKALFASLLQRLKGQGVTVLGVTHDPEFAALCADRCALFFGGRVVSAEKSADFFSENRFYTTAACRMTKDFYEHAVTDQDVIDLCLLNGRKEGGCL